MVPVPSFGDGRAHLPRYLLELAERLRRLQPPLPRVRL
jgi:hypothetical protein